MSYRYGARAPLTRTQVLRSRYDEARHIKDAWQFRLQRAQRAHSSAVRDGGDTEATRRNITAVEISFADAAAELQVAQQAWVNAVNRDLWPTRQERRAS